MELPQVTIKQEKVDNFILATEPNVNYKTEVLDLKEIKLESIKVEPCSYVFQPINLDHKLKCSDEAKLIVNNGMDISGHKILFQEKGLEIKIEESDEMGRIDKMENFDQIIKNKELNIKDEKRTHDEKHRKSRKLVLQKQRKRASANSDQIKKIYAITFKCTKCKYRASKQKYLDLHLERHKERNIQYFRCLNCKSDLPNRNEPEPTQQERHKLQKITIRRRCVVCYENVSAELGPKAAQSKTPRSPYQCTSCQKTFCLSCFFVKHNSYLI